MIIDAKTIVLTMIIVVFGFFAGVRLIRSFALQIAQENHDAVVAMDQAAEEARVKKEQLADAAAATAFAKVKPILTQAAAASTDEKPPPPSHDDPNAV